MTGYRCGPLGAQSFVTDRAASDTTVCDVQGITTTYSMGSASEREVAVRSKSKPTETASRSDPRALKARLFGDDAGDRLHKHLQKQRLLSSLQQVTEGLDTHEELEGATQPSVGLLPDSPVRVGRYAVLRKLGQGGMGVVYVAYDEDLDRKVALKLLRGELSQDERGPARMLREAQALARLSHPNVVQVHEVGRWSDHDYVAMEYVDGQTLERWLDERPRSWQEILDVLMQAGRGLAAAHAADLVHRDFKPANLLVGRDGRARVVDFGLARATNDRDSLAIPPSNAIETAEHEVPGEASTTGDDVASTTISSVFDQALTVTGARLGTLPYMAPEQHLGQTADALSDQFSFCVVLYEALYGERPFTGRSRDEYAIHVTEGKLAPTPSRVGVPLWLRKVVLRGLALRPADRWPSMDVLLAELGRDRTRTWRSVAAASALLLAFGVALSLEGAAPQLCERDRASVADTWDSAQREAVRAAFLKTELSEAEVVLAHTLRSLDDYADELVDARARACQDRWVAHSQTDAQMQLRHACLDQRERELAAVVEVLVDADREVVLHSPELIAGLGDVGLCARVDLLEAGTPAPRDADAIERIAAIRQVIADAHAALGVGRIEQAKGLAASARRSAKQIGFEPLLGELHYLEAKNAGFERDFARAKSHLIDAVAIAQRTGNLALSADAWIYLAHLEARADRDRAPHERLEFKLAETAVAQLGAPPRHAAALSLARGVALVEVGLPSQALPAFDRAIELAESGFVGSELLLSKALAVRARAWASLGRTAEARADLERVVSSSVGMTRTRIDARFDLAIIEIQAGDLVAGERDLRVAMAEYEALLGPTFEAIGHGHLALGNLALIRDQLDAAEAAFERALLILDESHDEHDYALDALASAHGSEHRKHYRKAEQALRKAIAHRKAKSPHDHVRLGYLHSRLATMMRETADSEQVIEEFGRAIDLLARNDVEAPLELAMALMGRGELWLDSGHPQLALSSLERAVELAPVDCGDAWLAGEARVLLAMALDQLGIREQEQRDLARAAVQLLKDLPSSERSLAFARKMSDLRSDTIATKENHP